MSAPSSFPPGPAFSPSVQVTAQRESLPAAINTLLGPIRSLELRAALHSQLVDIAREYTEVLGEREKSTCLAAATGRGR